MRASSETERKLLKGLIVNATRLIVGIGRAIQIDGDMPVEQAEKCAEEFSESLFGIIVTKER